MKDVEYTVSMLCPLCGNDQFEIIGGNSNSLEHTENTKFRCSDCGHEYTQEEIFEGNLEKMSSVAEEMAEDVAQDCLKELQASFRKWNR